jgi:hypothetical protein
LELWSGYRVKNVLWILEDEDMSGDLLGMALCVLDLLLAAIFAMDHCTITNTGGKKPCHAIHQQVMQKLACKQIKVLGIPDILELK